MVWVPKLPGALVCDSAEGAAAWGSKIGGQDRLPDDQNAESRVRMAGKKLFGCGGPPQTCCSSGREQEDNARLVCRAVKRALQFAEARCCQAGERRLSCRRLRRPPKVHAREQQRCRSENRDKKSFSHFRTGRNDPPKIPQSAAEIES